MIEGSSDPFIFLSYVKHKEEHDNDNEKTEEEKGETCQV